MGGVGPQHRGSAANGVAGTQAVVNSRLWEDDNHVAEYANRILRPVETVLLARYRERFAGRVLEIGCGGGRLLGYFLALDGEVHGIDVSPAMLDYCRRVYPQANVRLGDLRELTPDSHGPYDVVFASNNVLDVLPDDERRRVLRDAAALIAPGGLLIFSSHNLAQFDGVEMPAAAPRRRGAELLSKLAYCPPAVAVHGALSMPRRIRNHRRLAPLEHRASDHAVLNDLSHDYGLLHYYIARDDQARQLSELGYELVECRDLEGLVVAAGQRTLTTELHYVARPAV